MSELFTPPRSSHTCTSSLAQKEKLNVRFELRAKYGIVPGDVLHCVHTVVMQNNVATQPCPTSMTEFPIEKLTIQGGTNITYLGPVFDHWTNSVFLHFIYDSRSVFYDYCTQHQAGDEQFGVCFKKITK
jgi:hypothetical protein